MVAFSFACGRRGVAESNANVGNSDGESNQQNLTIELRPKKMDISRVTWQRQARGLTYRYRLDGDSYLYPDPARAFSLKPHGPLK